MENVGYGVAVSGRPKDEVRSRAQSRAGDRRPDRIRRPPAIRAVGRPAAARRRRPRAGARARGAAVRRAAVESRRAAAAADARGNPRPAAAAVADRRLRHPRPVRGDGRVGPHHRDEQGGDRAGRRAARALRAAARRVRRRLHGRRQSRARHARAPRRRHWASSRSARSSSGCRIAGSRRRSRRRDPARSGRIGRAPASAASPAPCARRPTSAA